MTSGKTLDGKSCAGIPHVKGIFVLAVASAVVFAVKAETYQVTANGITDGIDLTSMAGYDALSLAGPASGDVYMTGTVTHAEATVSNPFLLEGKGGGLNMFSTGLTSTPLKFTGTSGYFDFQNENITLGEDWRDQLQLPSYSSSFYVSFKTFDVSGGTDSNWLVFDPACRLYYDGTCSIGYKGGGSRVKVKFYGTRGCFWSDGRGHKRTNGIIYFGGVDTAGGVPGYVNVEVTNGTFYCYRAYFSHNVKTVNSTQGALGLTNIVTVCKDGHYQYGRIFRHGPDWVLFRFAGGNFQQNGYYGEMCNSLDNSSNEGGFIFESVDGNLISVSPHASSVGTDSKIVTVGSGDFYIKANDTDANENILGNKIIWNHTGNVRLGSDTSASLRIEGANALPYGEGKGDVRAECKYLCIDNSQTVNSIYGTANAYARYTGVTITVGAHGRNCRYKLLPRANLGTSISYSGNGKVSSRDMHPWDVEKIGAGTMTLECSVPHLLAVNEGAVRVTAEEADVPTLTMAAGTSLSVAPGCTLSLKAFDNENDASVSVETGGTLVLDDSVNDNDASVSVETGGTLLFFADDGETREVDLSGYSLSVGAVVGNAGAGKVVFLNLPAAAALFAKEGELEVQSVASGSSGAQASVTVADGATLTLDAGVALKTSSLTVRGASGAAETTYGGGGEPLAGLAGGGTVKVVPATAVWTGAGDDAKISNAANWQGGERPLLELGTQNAVFPADAARKDVVLDESAFFSGVSVGGVSYSFTGADSVFAFGTNGLSVAEPASEGGATYDFSVKVAQSGHGAWKMPTTSNASTIYFRRPLVDGAAPGRIYTSGTKFYFHTTNSTYTGDVFVTNAVSGAVHAYGAAPFGTNGTLRVRSVSNNNAVLSLFDSKIWNNVELDVDYSGRRKTIAFGGATNEFFGTFCNVTGQADNNLHTGTVIYHNGYGLEGRTSYINWNGAIDSAGVIHIYGRLVAGTVEQSGNEVHFHSASNTFGSLVGYNGTYQPVPARTRFHFYDDYAFYRTGYDCAAYGNWYFHGTEQRVGSLLCDNNTLYLDGFDGPGHLRCCQTHYFSNLAKSQLGVADYVFNGVFRGEMSFTLEKESTRKLVMAGVSSATGTVTVAGGTLCFTNGATWASATNVVVSGSGVLETYEKNTFGREADMMFSDSAAWDGHGQSQRVRFIYFNGMRQPLGTYCAEDYAGATSSMRRTPFVTGTGLLVSCGDGIGMTLIFR